jgi:hypothetical protein
MKIRTTLLIMVTALAPISAQTYVNNTEKQLKCEDRNGSGDSRQRRACEIREFTVSGVSKFVVDGQRNGGVSVKGWSNNSVLVRAKMEVWAPADAGDPAGMFSQVNVQTAGGNVRADAPDFGSDRGVAVSYEIFVPHRTGLDLKAHNGGISIRDVAGDIKFDAVNGGVTLARLAGNVTGSTKNGGLKVELDGSRWDGTQLDVRTTNGGVNVVIPDNYNARLETSTVNGGIHIDYPVTVSGKLKPNRELNVNLGSGGPLVRIATTNGGVTIRRKA